MMSFKVEDLVDIYNLLKTLTIFLDLLLPFLQPNKVLCLYCHNSDYHSIESAPPRNNDYILVKGLHESIIDDKTWDLVNNIRKVNSVPKKHNNQVQNPLAGLIICAIFNSISNTFIPSSIDCTLLLLIFSIYSL